jgi:hypothetical protein
MGNNSDKEQILAYFADCNRDLIRIFFAVESILIRLFPFIALAVGIYLWKKLTGKKRTVSLVILVVLTMVVVGCGELLEVIREIVLAPQ